MRRAGGLTAFTLIELPVVVAILAVLMAVREQRTEAGSRAAGRYRFAGTYSG